MTISPERERQLLASVEYPPAALRAIQFLLTRVRELERREAELTHALQTIAAGHDPTVKPVCPGYTIAREALEGGRNDP